MTKRNKSHLAITCEVTQRSSHVTHSMANIIEAMVFTQSVNSHHMQGQSTTIINEVSQWASQVRRVSTHNMWDQSMAITCKVSQWPLYIWSVNIHHMWGQLITNTYGVSLWPSHFVDIYFSLWLAISSTFLVVCANDSSVFSASAMSVLLFWTSYKFFYICGLA